MGYIKQNGLQFQKKSLTCESPCTSKEQLTLHIDNCMGCPHFHNWKFKWKFFVFPRDFTCFLY